MKALIYTKPICPFCIRAKEILTAHDIEFKDLDVSSDLELRQKISDSVGGYRTVPMIFLDEKFIGGYSELQALEAAGKLS